MKTSYEGPFTDVEAMQMAIAEAQQGFGFVAPNPPVGCVILSKEGYLLSKGFHARVGGEHAEVRAIQNLEDLSLLKEAQVFVTLEPCAHEGRTPSCAKLLAKTSISRVVYGLQDPNPRVNGKGAEILLSAGKQVQQISELQNELMELVEIFWTNMTERRAFLTLKVASSLDGQMALSSGESQWITGEGSREKAQFLRGCYDTVMVGLGTFQKDNPGLNIRHPHFTQKSNKVILIDPRAESLAQLSDSKLWQNHRPEEIFVVLNWEERKKFSYPSLKAFVERMEAGALEEVSAWQDAEKGWTYIFPKRLADNYLDLKDLQEILFEKSVTSIFCEGGSKVHGQLLKQKAADRLNIFVNMGVLGKGKSWSEGLSLPRLEERVRLLHPHVEVLNEDLFISGKLSYQ